MVTNSLPIRFGPLTAADRPRILEISAGVWEGHDYIPAVIDTWLVAADDELIGGWVGDTLVGFAHLVRVSPAYAWFEGLRVDSPWQNRGVGTAFTRFMLRHAAAIGARHVGLSVYLENAVSRHVIESQGFEQMAGFIFLEKAAERPWHAPAAPAEVISVPADEAAAFIARSDFLALGNGFLPYSWRFYPFAQGPERLLQGMTHLLGVRHDGQWAGLLCASRGESASDAIAINLLDGDHAAQVALARHVLHLAEGAPVEAMLPATAAVRSRAVEVLTDLGFETWNEGQPDVFVYEREVGPASG